MGEGLRELGLQSLILSSLKPYPLLSPNPCLTRLGDNDSGHDQCPPRPLSTASNNVFVNNKGAGRIGDSYPAHSCDIHPPHTGAISSGSSSVFINGRKAARVGDSVSCGGNVAQGSNNVFVGG